MGHYCSFHRKCSHQIVSLILLPSYALAILVGTFDLDERFSGFYRPRLDGRDIDELAITIKANAGAILDRWLVVVCHGLTERTNLLSVAVVQFH